MKRSFKVRIPEAELSASSGAIVHRFRGPNEPHQAGSCFETVVEFVAAIMCNDRNFRRLRRAPCSVFDSNHMQPVLAAAARLTNALAVLRCESAKLIALVHYDEDRRSGLAVWGAPKPSNTADALRVCQNALAALHDEVQALAERAVIEAAAEDRATAMLAAGNAVYVPGQPSVVVARPRMTDPEAPPGVTGLKFHHRKGSPMSAPNKQSIRVRALEEITFWRGIAGPEDLNVKPGEIFDAPEGCLEDMIARGAAEFVSDELAQVWRTASLLSDSDQ